MYRGFTVAQVSAKRITQRLGHCHNRHLRQDRHSTSLAGVTPCPMGSPGMLLHSSHRGTVGLPGWVPLTAGTSSELVTLALLSAKEPCGLLRFPATTWSEKAPPICFFETPIRVAPHVNTPLCPHRHPRCARPLNLGTNTHTLLSCTRLQILTDPVILIHTRAGD